MYNIIGYPGAPVVKNLPANPRDAGSIPGSGRSPGKENGNLLYLVFLPGKYHVQRSLVGTVRGITKELDRT